MYGWPDDWRDDSVSLRWVRNGTDPNVPESVRSLEIDLVESYAGREDLMIVHALWMLLWTQCSAKRQGESSLQHRIAF